MPELPEVEQVRRSLQELIVGKTIHHVDVRLARIVRTPDDASQFAAELQWLTVESVERRGKHLLLHLPPYTLVSHLRMEGQYRLAQAGEPEATHTHVVFYFTDGTELRYRDVRQFGTMDLIPQGHALLQGGAKLGPEPFDEALTAKVFHERLHRKSAPIKAVLLDQATIAGLGNIYVDEALFGARIHPLRPASDITRPQAARLLDEIRDVLTRAIDAGGTSIKTYVDGYGRHGGFQIDLSVYGREGEPCRVCGIAIVKSRVAGRGTHTCPKCQTKPRSRTRARKDS